MATMCVAFQEDNQEIQPLKAGKKGFHFVSMRLDGLVFSDEEVAQYAQALGMMLLSAVREQKLVLQQ